MTNLVVGTLRIHCVMKERVAVTEVGKDVCSTMIRVQVGSQSRSQNNVR
jgi:hypothetical protein